MMKLLLLSKRKEMVKWFWIFFCIFLSLSFNLNNLYASNEALVKSLSLKTPREEYSIEELPIIVIAYSLFCARYDEFKSLESNSQNPLVKLKKNIDALPGGISTGLCFTHRAFIVQNREDHLSGFVRIKNKTLEESKVPFENILFVTTPIESLGNRVLLILSSVSPERTTIAAIDNKLNVELLYDSFEKNVIKNMEYIKGSRDIGSIYSIRVKKPGIFLLEERMERGGRKFVSPYKNRTFIMDVSKGVFEISMKFAGKAKE